MAGEQSVEQQVLDLVRPGVQIIFYLSDGTTARVRASTMGSDPSRKIFRTPCELHRKPGS
jgi:hypothetical protein